MFFKDSSERELLYRALSVVARGRLDGDVRGYVAMELFNVEEAISVNGRGRAKAEVDVEQSSAGSLMMLHVLLDAMCVVRRVCMHAR